MPRDGSGVFSAPAGTSATPLTAIESAKYNALVSDLVQDANTARPVVAGGTGATTAQGAIDSFFGAARTVVDERLQLVDPSDATKISRLDSGSLPTATTHVINAAWLQRKSADIASASTVDLSTATGGLVTITGTTTITSLGTVQAGTEFKLVFADELTLTHNATSLILLENSNIQTRAGDVVTVVSEGSGNWRCVNHQATIAPTYKWIARFNDSGQSAAPFTDLSEYFSLRIEGTLVVSTNAFLLLRTSTDNGANYDSGATDYASPSTETAMLLSTAAVGAVAGGGIHFIVEITNFNKSARAQMIGQSAYLNGSSNLVTDTLAALRLSSTARNALQILPSSGTIEGVINVWGLKG